MFGRRFSVTILLNISQLRDGALLATVTKMAQNYNLIQIGRTAGQPSPARLSKQLSEEKMREVHVLLPWSYRIVSG